MTVDGTNGITFPDASAQPKASVQPPQSMVRVNTANGYGSTNIDIARLTTVVTNQGSDITYADSATLGALFTINTSGVYSISYTYCGVAGGFFGISLNSTGLSTVIQSITATERLCLGQIYGASATSTISTCMYLPAGSLIRPHGDATTNGTAANHQCTIVRVA